MDPDPGGLLITDPKKTTSKSLFTFSMEEPGEQCIVVFALIVTELASECVRGGGGGVLLPPSTPPVP
jgi:hypothetical protein